MKKFHILLLTSCVLGVFAQGQYSHLHETTIGVHYFQNTFATAPFEKFLASNSGIAVGYLTGIAKRFDGQIKLSGSFPVGAYRSRNYGSKDVFVETDVTVRERVLPEKSVSPFVTGGPGLYLSPRSRGFYGLCGIGVEIKLGAVYFILQADRRFVFAGDVLSHYQYGIGLAGKIFERRQTKKTVASVAPVVRVVPDRDGDGIVDANDDCPDSAGLAENCGCPLSVVKLLTVASQNICIICEVDSISKHILFETNKAVIQAASIPYLDSLVSLMKNKENICLLVKGHTDNVGAKERNLQLSRDRAEAVRAYLMLGGVNDSRISTEGLGDGFPVDRNDTEQGRRRNRRVEVVVVKD